ncbi:unnamed protein product [Closterium sp. NIES-53]
MPPLPRASPHAPAARRYRTLPRECRCPAALPGAALPRCLRAARALPTLPVRCQWAARTLPAAVLLRVLPAHCQHAPRCPARSTARAALPCHELRLATVLLSPCWPPLPCLAAAQHCRMSYCPA